MITNLYKKNIYSGALLFLFTLVAQNCSQDSTDPSDSDSTPQEQLSSSTAAQGQDALPVKKQKELKEWPRLTSSDIFVAGTQPVSLFSDHEGKEKACELAPGSEFLITARLEHFYQLRLDRISESQSACPEGLNAGYVFISAQSQQAATLDAHTLNFDLRVFKDADLQGEPICVLAKGTGVLTSMEPTPFLQMPKSSLCEKSVTKAYFYEQASLWYESQPR